MFGITLRHAYALPFLFVFSSALAQEQFHPPGETVRDIAIGAKVSWLVEDATVCPGGEFGPPCIIRGRSPSGFGTLLDYQSSTTTNAIHSTNFDTQGAWVYFLGQSSVLRKSVYDVDLSSVTVLATRANSGSPGEIAVTDTHVWWSELHILYRAPINGGARETMYTAPFDAEIRQLRADSAGGIWFLADAFIAPDTMTRFTVGGGATFGPAYTNTYALDDTHVYMAVGNSTGERRLRRATLDNLPGHTAGAQLHPSGDATAPRVVTMSAPGNDLFYFKDVANSSQEAIWRLPKSQWSSGVPAAVTGQRSAVENIEHTSEHIYWHEAGGAIMRLPLTGLTPIQADASITAIEVVQAVQKPDNSIGLVDKKRTTARVFPQVSGLSGLSGINVTVSLTGTRDGVPLTFPPPPQTRRLADFTPDRRNLGDTFNFVLPTFWREGTIDLTATISISGIADSNTANNSFTETGLVFQPKAPICIKFLPVLNTAGLTYRVRNLSTGEFNPAWRDIYNRFLSMWPSPEVPFYTQTTSLRKPAFLGPAGPFNLMDGIDKDFVMAALWEHNVWDNAPGWCERDNARTLYFAMVPEGIEGGPGGFARFWEPLFYVKMRSGGWTNFDRPGGGAVTMQEVVHTYNDLLGTNEHYQHVNCGLPTGGDFNALYPYDADSIGTQSGVLDPAAGWGYDPISETLIPPDQEFFVFNDGDGMPVNRKAVDYMSYCIPRWTSDYSWNRMINRLPNRPPTARSAKQPHRGAGLVSDVLMVNGVINHHEDGGEIINAFYVPAGLTVEPTASGGGGEFGATGTYTLDLLDGGGGVLASHPVIPTHSEDHTDAEENFYFHATVPYSPGLASFRIRKDGVLDIATAMVSPNAPTVSIVAPTAGASLAAPLSISWTGNDTDGDSLTYIVQYSADGGNTWSVIANGYTDTTLELEDTSELTASSEAYIRVLASDGINMGFASVGPLNSPNHPPVPAILLPAADRAFEVDEAVSLEGTAIDFDEGILASSSLGWLVSGPTSTFGNGALLQLAGLAPGSYTAELSATDSGGLAASTTSNFTVAPKFVSDSSAPVLDGHCTDSAYSADAHALLLRYSSGTPAVVRLVRNGSGLYICASGMQLLSTTGNESLGLYFDPNNSAGSAPGTGDLGILLRRTGVMEVFDGNGAGFTQDTTPEGVEGLAIGDGNGLWQAELRVDTSRLNGWNHLARVGIVHAFGFFQARWPADASGSNPDSWGLSAFGLQAQSINFPQPPNLTVGDEPVPANATATSGLPVTLTTETPDICSIISGALINPVAAGTCTIEATQAGSAAYLPAVAVSRSLAVNANTGNVGEPNDTFATATPIPGACPQMTLSRQLTAGDVDFYSFSGPADLPVAVDIDANEAGGMLNSVLGVFDNNGNLIASNDDGTGPGESSSLDSYLVFNMPSSGQVTIAVAGFDDFDFDGVATQGPSSGPYDLDVRCWPEPGQLLGTTGNVQNLLLDIDPNTGDGVQRAQLGAFGPITDIAFCGGKLYGAVGGGVAQLVTIDPLTGSESFVCTHGGDSLGALACIDGQLHGAWNATFPDSASDLVRIGNPVAVATGSLGLSAETVESTAPGSYPFGAAGGAVNSVSMDVEFTTSGFAWGSDLYLVLTHLPSGTSIRYGSASPGASCDFYGGCDVDLGWPNAAGTYTATLQTPLSLNSGGGTWELSVQTLYDNADAPEGTLSGTWQVNSGSCALNLIGDIGAKVPGMAWDAANQQLFGCTNSGVLLEIDHNTAQANGFQFGSVDNCRALAFSNGPGAGLYGGSGANGTSTPGLLFTYETSNGATTPIGPNFVGSLSGLAFAPEDTDRDSVYDSVDNCLLVPNADQRDTDIDGFGNLCDSDIAPAVNDCITNFGDLDVMKSAFFTTPQSPGWNPDADMNGDGIVNFTDLDLMKQGFFAAPGPSGVNPVCTPCALNDTGFDHAESFGQEMYVRGSFNGWAADQTSRLINLSPGADLYAVELLLPAGSHEMKIAAGDWSLEYDEPPTPLDEGVPEFYSGSPPDSSENIPLSVGTTGCYRFDIEATPSGTVPAEAIIMEVNKAN